MTRFLSCWSSLFWIFCYTFFSCSLAAAEVSNARLPEPLKSWVPWVVDEIPNFGCPHDYTRADMRWCNWTAALELNLDERGGNFKTSVYVFEKSWLTLPGDSKNWPQQVSVNNQVVAIADREGKPAIFLTPGNYQLQGQFGWSSLPESLALPAYSVILRMQLHGKTLPVSQLDQENRLWLKREVRQDQQDDLQVSVFRKLIDGVPLQLETIYKLEVSGKGREIILPHAILPDWLALQVNSPLSSSLSEQGDLKLQARTGTWEVRILARHPANPAQLSLPASSGAEALEEIWVWQANPDFRSVSLQGVPSIDAQQTNLPSDWSKLPAYLLQPGQSLQLKQNSRGESENLPDKLKLQRRIWLSFDGKQLSIQDHLDGVINRAGRLQIHAPLVLGRVSQHDNPMLITKGADQQAGIEVRRGNLQLVADSQLAYDGASLSAAGWQRDLDSLSISLQVPPGWRLFYAPGVDYAANSWLSAWNLASVFMVLLCSLAVYQLVGWRYALLASLTLVLCHHEETLISKILLLSLALIALSKFLPAGRLQAWANRFSFTALLFLSVLALGFSIQQARSALYPVLDDQFVEQQAYGSASRRNEAEPMDANKEVAVETTIVEAKINESIAPPPKLMAPSKNVSDNYQQVQKKRQQIRLDPDNKVQTGPGMPSWGWRAYQLRFDGPVNKAQQLSLWLMPPWLNAMLAVLRILSLATLIAVVLNFAWKNTNLRERLSKITRSLSVPAKTLSGLILCVLFIAASVPHSAYAELPDEALLNSLKERLSKPADCLPQCVDLARLQVRLEGQQLKLNLDIDAQSAVAFPLPGNAKYWLAEQASYAGKPAFIQRGEAGQIVLLTQPGRHTLEMSGQLLNPDSLVLALPHKPRKLEVQAAGWDWTGWSEEHGAANSLQLTRKLNAQEQMKVPRVPAFLKVTRVIDLDKEWHVETSVSKVGDEMVALAEIPLLEGESVTTAGINVKDGKVQLNLTGKEASLSWTSNLKNSSLVKLQAPKHSLWSERWILRYQPVWHVEYSGVPPSVWQQGELAESEFQPWPGEQLQLRIERPLAVSGQTLTIQDSTLSINPGARSSDYLLHLVIVSSQGGEHKIKLPKAAQLLSLTRDGSSLALHDQQGSLLLPVQPGSQSFDISWRSNQGLSAWFSSEVADLGQSSVNHKVQLQLGSGRWLLATSGTGAGPVILFWGQLLVLFLIAALLGRLRYLPLRRYEWFLLALGLSQCSVPAILVALSWFFVFTWRSNLQAGPSRWRFNLLQIALLLFTLINLLVYLQIVYQGLLGMPEMQIVGNASSYFKLQWYVDRCLALLPQIQVLSLPILWYRGLMLLWALWLAWHLLQWLQWGWRAWSTNGYWRSASPKIVIDDKPQAE